MKSRFALIFVIVFTALVVPRVFAQESAPQTNEEFASERCALAQNYIKDIQKPRDLRARVDRLQGYRYIYQRIDMFTKRLERNKQPQAYNLRASLNAFNKDIEDFKNRYEEYDQARDSVTKVANCKANIATFQEKLTDARTKRGKVNQTVVALEQVLNPAIKDRFEVLYQELLATGKTGDLHD